ncbi:MAG: hypothetical protein K2L02_05910, partial [Clostridia bacterium]|nr:hypothetical protein [Clostridia bacterium]
HMVQLCSALETYEGCRVLYDFSYPLRKGEEEKVVVQNELLETPNEIAGTMKIYLENRLLFSQNLFIMNE